MSRVRREQSVEFVCIGTCEDPPTYMVEGRFDAEGEFEPTADEMVACIECDGELEPTDSDVRVSDL